MLNDENIERYAFTHFTDRLKTEENFKESFLRLQTVRKHLSKFKQKGEINSRLLLNHIIILFNSFEHEAALNMLIYECREFLGEIKAALLVSNRLPPFIRMFSLNTLEIPVNTDLLEKLKECC